MACFFFSFADMEEGRVERFRMSLLPRWLHDAITYVRGGGVRGEGMILRCCTSSIKAPLKIPHLRPPTIHPPILPHNRLKLRLPTLKIRPQHNPLQNRTIKCILRSGVDEGDGGEGAGEGVDKGGRGKEGGVGDVEGGEGV